MESKRTFEIAMYDTVLVQERQSDQCFPNDQADLLLFERLGS